MPEPLFTKKIAASNIPFKFAKFHQSLLRFGLPLAALTIGIDYVAFRITTSGSGLSYPWVSSILFAVPAALAAAAVWWLLMREIAAWKRKNQL
jgi:hypothetical protein